MILRHLRFQNQIQPFSKVPAVINLNPERNYSVTVKSTNNPSFGVLDDLDPLFSSYIGSSGSL